MGDITTRKTTGGERGRNGGPNGISFGVAGQVTLGGVITPTVGLVPVGTGSDGTTGDKAIAIVPIGVAINNVTGIIDPLTDGVGGEVARRESGGDSTPEGVGFTVAG